jgi:hypothetical protein
MKGKWPSIILLPQQPHLQNEDVPELKLRKKPSEFQPAHPPYVCFLATPIILLMKHGTEACPTRPI